MKTKAVAAVFVAIDVSSHFKSFNLNFQPNGEQFVQSLPLD